ADAGSGADGSDATPATGDVTGTATPASGTAGTDTPGTATPAQDSVGTDAPETATGKDDRS
ncbi:NADH-quinone oxidoreductase subunit NuoE, partial [Corynebacterium bovis]